MPIPRILWKLFLNSHTIIINGHQLWAYSILGTLHNKNIIRMSLHICHVHCLVLISITHLLRKMVQWLGTQTMESDCLGSSLSSDPQVMCDLEQIIGASFSPLRGKYLTNFLCELKEIMNIQYLGRHLPLSKHSIDIRDYHYY